MKLYLEITPVKQEPERINDTSGNLQCMIYDRFTYLLNKKFKFPELLPGEYGLQIKCKKMFREPIYTAIGTITVKQKE